MTPKLECPHCGEWESRVTDARPSTDGIAFCRRRECLACGHRYTTDEKIRETTTSSSTLGTHPQYPAKRDWQGVLF